MTRARDRPGSPGRISATGRRRSSPRCRRKTGKKLWTHRVGAPPTGCATVASRCRLRADARRPRLRVRHAKTAGCSGRRRTRAGINGCPSVAGATLRRRRGRAAARTASAAFRSSPPTPSLGTFPECARWQSGDNARLEPREGRRPTACSRTSRRSCTASATGSSSCSPRSLCRGHVLFEDVPGTAKTVLARAIAGSIGGATPSRIQCTPDLQPTDVTGLSVYNQQTREFEFRPGPVFANILLVDEINRAMPKTQSALLEAMAERQVTVDGVHARAARPVPRARDREPDRAGGHVPAPRGAARPLLPQDRARLPERRRGDRDRARAARAPSARRPEAGRHARRGRASSSARSRTSTSTSSLLRWIVELVAATRELEQVALGASVRASLALERTARAWALLHGRDYVTPDDVETLFLPVIGHRVVFTPTFVAENRLQGRDGRARASSATSCFDASRVPSRRTSAS